MSDFAFLSSDLDGMQPHSNTRREPSFVNNGNFLLELCSANGGDISRVPRDDDHIKISGMISLNFKSWRPVEQQVGSSGNDI